ncbi:MAG: 2OG-Fe(II) oxygenase [Alphaproteobacteria bacterium]|nr:2OG-Fe(II) oxygenase [Alphaproteobacteria bacterium]
MNTSSLSRRYPAENAAPFAAAAEITRGFVNCLLAASHVRRPFDYWLLDDALPAATADALNDLPVGPPQGAPAYGKRELNNASRVYFSEENQKKYPVCREMVEAFKGGWITSAIKALTGHEVSEGLLRIEYCQDTDGFWLEPHTDISVKLFTMQIYLSEEPELSNAGTSIYDATPEHSEVATAPYGKGKGILFIPGKDTWHGFTPRPLRGVRKSVIVNYVTNDWRSRDELA